MPRKTVSERTRAAAIADLQAGEQPAVVAERYGVDRRKINVWKQRYVINPVAEIAPTTNEVIQRPQLIEQQHRMGEIVLELLAAKLQASKAIAQLAQDADWLRRQDAGELAALAEQLDSTAFAIGDRLAGRAAAAERDADSTE